MRQTQSCHVSNDTLSPMHTVTARRTHARALTPHSYTGCSPFIALCLSLSLSICVWVKKGLLYIGYRYREVYRIEYIDRLYIFLVNRYWLSATQSNQTVCDIAHRASKHTVSNRSYVLERLNCPLLLVIWFFSHRSFVCSIYGCAYACFECLHVQHSISCCSYFRFGECFLNNKSMCTVQNFSEGRVEFCDQHSYMPIAE